MDPAATPVGPILQCLEILEPPGNHGIYRWYMAPKIALWVPKQRIYMFNQLDSCGNQAVFVDIQSSSFQGSSIYRFNHSQEGKSVWRRWKFPMFWGAQRYARRSEEVQTGEDEVLLHRCQIEKKHNEIVTLYIYLQRWSGDGRWKISS